MYGELLAFLKPGVTIGHVVEKTRELGSQVAPSTGPLAGSYARLTLHGRGLGDDHPLVLDSGRPGQSEIYEGTKRAWDAQLPENGVYICKPAITTADGQWSFAWGDTVRTTARGAVRMGKSPHGVIISEPHEVSWPQD